MTLANNPDMVLSDDFNLPIMPSNNVSRNDKGPVLVDFSKASGDYLITGIGKYLTGLGENLKDTGLAGSNGGDL